MFTENENTNVTLEPQTNVTPIVDNDDLDTTPDVIPEEPEILFGVVADCAKLNVRKAPDAAAPIICTIPRDSEVEVQVEESTDEFYKVLTASGIEGFCMAKYIKI